MSLFLEIATESLVLCFPPFLSPVRRTPPVDNVHGARGRSSGPAAPGLHQTTPPCRLLRPTRALASSGAVVLPACRRHRSPPAPPPNRREPPGPNRPPLGAVLLASKPHTPINRAPSSRVACVSRFLLLYTPYAGELCSAIDNPSPHPHCPSIGT